MMRNIIFNLYPEILIVTDVLQQEQMGTILVRFSLPLGASSGKRIGLA
jgi:hypothetical protein